MTRRMTSMRLILVTVKDTSTSAVTLILKRMTVKVYRRGDGH